MTTSTIVALAAGGLALLDLGLALWFLLWMRRVRRAQQALLAGRNVDLVEFAVGMQTRAEHVEALVGRMEQGLQELHARVDGAFQRRAIVRYDALRDAGGNQSASVAIVDAGGSGVVLTAIQGRDYARIYVKDVVSGDAGSVELTPEERQAVSRALER